MSPAERRTPKSLRLGAEDLGRLQALLAALPKFGSESEVLSEAVRRGLILLIAEVFASGRPVEGERRTGLARRLAVELLPVFELLVQEDALPAMLRTWPVTNPTPPPPAAPAALSPTVKADLAGLGSGFLDDDDDE